MTRLPAARFAAEALIRLEKEKGYSNILLANKLSASGMNARDRALATRLFYGVIERRLTLDYLIESCCAVKRSRIHPAVYQILRLGAYQLAFMTNIPPAAAVNGTAELTKIMRMSSATGLVNGVLRNVERNWRRLLNAIPDSPDGWEIAYSVPRPLIDLWIEGYGIKRAEELVKNGFRRPKRYLRANTALTTADKIERRLKENGVPCRKTEGLPDCVETEAEIPFGKLDVLPENRYYFQDVASQWCCQSLGARPGEKIADVCAAPGGKSFTVAQYLHNTGTVCACDIYPEKCSLMAKRAAELSIKNVKILQRDASLPCREEEKAAFDRVLCDVPCSGWGALRRKPEIRYKDVASAKGLPELQLRILCEASAMVKPGGVLQYSTCTLNPSENERVAERFLGEHSEYSPKTLPLSLCFRRAGLPPSNTITLFPEEQFSDGFFIAAFQRMR